MYSIISIQFYENILEIRHDMTMIEFDDIKVEY